MSERLRTVVFDLGVREENWSSGLVLRGDSRAGVLFGKGLGTYPRIVLASKPGDRFPTNFVVDQDGGYRFLSLHAGLPTYFGQKVPVQPDQQYRLFGAMRSPDGKGVLTLILCEKLLLYSTNCRNTTFRIHTPGNFGSILLEDGRISAQRSRAKAWMRRRSSGGLNGQSN